MPKTGSVTPDGTAPRKPRSGIQKLVAPNATTAAMMKPAEPRRAARHDLDRPARHPQIDRNEQSAEDKDRGKNRYPQSQRQPIAVLLAELDEPVILQSNREDRLECDDRDDHERDIGKIPIDPVDKSDRRRVAPILPHRHGERQRSEDNEDQVAEGKHQALAPGPRPSPPLNYELRASGGIDIAQPESRRPISAKG